MSKRTRRNHSTEQKAALLKRHLVDGVPVSDLCDEAGIQPSLFYYWQRQLFENAHAALAPGKKPEVPNRELELAAENERLRAKLARKDEVIAEISEDFVKLKKELGEL